MLNDIADRIDTLKQNDFDITKIVLEQAAVEELQEHIDENDNLLGYEYIVDEAVNGGGYAVAHIDEKSHLGLPTPSRIEKMVQNVEPVDAGNIVFGSLDLFAELSRKYVDLDEETMDEAEVDYEGDEEFSYEDMDTSRIEPIRIEARVEDDVDSDRDFDDMVSEFHEVLVRKVKHSIYKGERIEEIKVNGPIPDDADDDFEPERYHVGDKVAEFDRILLGNEEEERVETEPAKEEL